MKISELTESTVTEAGMIGSVGDWVKSKATGTGDKMWSMARAVPAAVGSALGMDPNRPGVEKAKSRMARANFAKVFSQKMSGMLRSQIADIQKQMAAAQAADPAAPAAPAATTAQPTAPRQSFKQKMQARGTPVRKESLDYKLRVALNEDEAQAAEFRQKMINWLTTTVTNYMGGVDLSAINGDITQLCTTAFDSAVAGKYDNSFLDLGGKLFDQYNNDVHQQVQTTNPVYNVSLTPNGTQAMQTLEKLPKKERDIIFQKLKDVP